MLDISESGRQIGEKLFALLSTVQQQELSQYAQMKTGISDIFPNHASSSLTSSTDAEPHLTEVRSGELYFCLENRIVHVSGKEITLTAKEFDILALLITNPSRVFTFEVITDEVWHESADIYSRKAINNHICNLRRKLRVSPQTPDYITSVHGVGYKFNSNTDTS